MKTTRPYLYNERVRAQALGIMIACGLVIVLTLGLGFYQSQRNFTLTWQRDAAEAR